MADRDPRAHRLFRAHPDREVTLTSGAKVRLPFHGYRVETLVVAGTVKLEPLARWLLPEDLMPVRLRQDDGRSVGAAWIWVFDYADSNAGAFRQLIVALGGAQDSLVLPMRSAAAPVAALVHPSSRALLRWMVTGSEDVVTLGREVWGLPSEPGTIAWTRGPDRMHCRITDASGAEILDVEARDRRGALRRLIGGVHASRAMGFEQAARMVLAPSLAFTLITPREVHANRIPARLHGHPILYRWKPSDTLRLGTRTPIGAALADLGFTPTAVLRHPDARFVLLDQGTQRA